MFFTDQGKISGSNRLWISHCQEQDFTAEWSAARDASLPTRWCVGRFTFLLAFLHHFCHKIYWGLVYFLQ